MEISRWIIIHYTIRIFHFKVLRLFYRVEVIEIIRLILRIETKLKKLNEGFDANIFVYIVLITAPGARFDTIR